MSGLLLVIVALACFLHYPGPNVPMAVFFTVAAAFHSAIVVVCFANLSARRRYENSWEQTHTQVRRYKTANQSELCHWIIPKFRDFN